jgi:hypothetical protein
MKPRHAAALALVGWYLMVPPIISHAPKPDLSAPKSKWSAYGPFSSQGECERRHRKMITYGDSFQFRARMKILSSESALDDELKCLAAGHCILRDDPRGTSN